MTKEDAKRAPLGEIFTRNFLMLATINLAMFFGFQMLNVGLPMYMDQLGASAQIVGLATTLMTVTATVVRVFAGALLDRFGRMGMLVSGAAIMACAIISFAIFPIVGVILGIRLLHGVGWGLGSTASSTIAADIIPKHRFAEGMGYFAMTNAISSAIAPAASIELVNGPGSFVMIYVAGGITALSLVLSIVEAVIARRKAARQDDAEAQAIPGKPAGPERPKAPAANPPKTYSKLETLFDRRAIMPGILMMLVNIGFGCITTFIALHAKEQGVEGVSLYFVVYAVVTLVSRPYIGRLIDRYGYRIPAILSTLCTAGTLAVIGLGGSIWMFSFGGVLAGLGIGTAMGVFQAMAVASVEPWRRGVATSTFMTAFDLGIAIGSYTGGVLVGIAGYAVMFYVFALFPLAASALSFVTVKKQLATPADNQQPPSKQ